MQRKRLVIGVTGGISTGKSTVLRMLEKLGAQTLSADDIARDVLSPGKPAYQEVVSTFGQDVVTGSGEINRAKLAEIIFADADAREQLNRITHPRIIKELQTAIDQFRNNPRSEKRVLAVEIPLLFECGLQDMVDYILLVAAEQGVQVHRLTTRTGITIDEAVRRLQSQLPIDEKLSGADSVIWNNGNIEELQQAVEEFWHKLVVQNKHTK
ncbi:MAG: dephospho-CoA kinase [Armatimonadota bacterium]